MKKTVLRLLCVLLLISAVLLNPTNTRATTVECFIIDSYEEYEGAVRNEKPAYGFVEYEDIKVLGVFFDYAYSGDCLGKGWFDYSGHMYTNILDFNRFVNQFFYRYEDVTYRLIDRNKVKLSLQIVDDKSYFRGILPDENDFLARPTDMSDMRHLGTEESGYIQRGSMVYRYYEGDLREIMFQLGETHFRISGSLAKYPIDGEQTIVSQLLSKNDLVAELAYQRLIADIPAQANYYKPIFVQIIHTYCLFAVVCIVCVIVINRIQKRRKSKGSLDNAL
ncbi:MAG: hypothetical protein E7438_00545 [Ruminococcaceae bacterium]|nr:hypothetical protein [Oscillospiraceae bacterium]